MRIPEEDLGPAWLRDWQHIEADIQAMDDFAKKLRADVETNYVSHLTPIYDDMATPLPGAGVGFAELDDLLNTHHQATQTTTNFVHDYANRSAHMADAASKISSNYGEADAFANATVSTVHRALGETGVDAPNTGAPPPPAAGGPPEGATIPTTEGY
jgi:hypothetical protein